MRSHQAVLAIKASVLIVFLLAGLRYVIIANDWSSSSFTPDTPATFLKTLYNNSSYMGIISVTLTTKQSFVVGANISAEIKIGLPNAADTAYLIEVMFLDAISVRDIPPYSWQQDWNYLLSDIQIVGSEQVQTLSNVTLVYAHEGLYGLNVTIHPLDLHFHFYDLVQIKPMSYLQEKLRSDLSFAMNFQILGLTTIMVAPIIVQLIGFIQQYFKEETPKKHPEKGPNHHEKANYDSDSGDENVQKPRKKKANETADLLKVQIYADRSHTKLTSLLSFIFAYFIGLMVLFYTVLYQGLGPNPATVWAVGLIGTGISTIGFLGYVLWDYNWDVKTISRMIEAVKKGTPLPEFEELSKAFARKRLRIRTPQELANHP